MKSFNNKNSTKQELLNKLKHHQDLDAFIQGTWLSHEKAGRNVFKGCFYGCIMQSRANPIQQFSKQYNIDLWYCFVTERIFEDLPNGQYQKFPYESIEIIPVGFDLNTIKSKFFQNILKKQLEWVTNDKVILAINKCIELFDIPFDHIAVAAATSLATEAQTATISPCDENSLSADVSVYATKVWADDIWAANAASWAVSDSAAAFASAYEVALDAAKENHYVWMRDMLFDLIKEKNEK